MNNRIKELANEAGFHGESMYPVFGTCQDTSLENFARLIIEECISACATDRLGKTAGAEELIYARFGMQ